MKNGRRSWLIGSMLALVCFAPPARADIDEGKLRKYSEKLVAKVASDPADTESWLRLGVAQCKLAQYKESRESLERAQVSHQGDFFLHSYLALSCEELGDFASAAENYRRAAQSDSDFASELVARAALLERSVHVRPRDPAQALSGDTALAVLPPVDLGEEPSGLPLHLGEMLALSLDLHPGVDVLGPTDSELWLAADGRQAADLEDTLKRDRVGRSLSRRGVSMVLASSFLRMDTGECHYQLTLLPVSAEGVGEAVTVGSDVGAPGAELAPFANTVPRVWTELGLEARDVESPQAMDVAEAFGAGVQAMREGDAARAAQAWCTASQRAPELLTLAQWCSQLRSAVEESDSPLGRTLGDPAVVLAALDEIARKQEKRERKFDDLDD